MSKPDNSSSSGEGSELLEMGREEVDPLSSVSPVPLISSRQSSSDDVELPPPLQSSSSSSSRQAQAYLPPDGWS